MTDLVIFSSEELSKDRNIRKYLDAGKREERENQEPGKAPYIRVIDLQFRYHSLSTVALL